MYSALIHSLLLGIAHVQDTLGYATTTHSDNPPEIPFTPVSFDEAIQYLSASIPVSREEWDELEKLLRHRAFTVARLAELDAINRIREKLKEVLSSGKTFQQFWEEAGADELLKAAGFHESNPWYWETVFRTNIQSAYNAGRRLQIARSPNIKYLEFIGIRDSRQTEICRSRSGVIRPANDSWWTSNWPPLHFSCRSCVRPIHKAEAEVVSIKPTPPSRLKDIPSPQDGFGIDPLNVNAFWGLTPGMIERARRYGILSEIKKLATSLGIDYSQIMNRAIVIAEIPVRIEQLTQRLNRIKEEYSCSTPAPILIAKDPLARTELNAVGLADYNSGQIWLEPRRYEIIENILRKGTIDSPEDAAAFKTLVHEFGHLLGKPTTRDYITDKTYRTLVEAINDIWAIDNVRALAKHLGLTVNVSKKDLILTSGYKTQVDRALKIFRAAGIKREKVAAFINELNTGSIDTRMYGDEIDAFLSSELGLASMPPDLYIDFGRVLIPGNTSGFEYYINKIRRLRARHQQFRD